MERPVGIDLFAGAGGFSLGFEQAGFDVAAAVEFDPIHAAVHKFNFLHCATIPASVIGLSATEIRQRANLVGRQVHVVFGGAPCQGFSLMGHRALDDPRNRLVLEFVRIVRELDASYFVFENVKGLTIGRHRQFLNELVGEFESVGYRLRLPWRVLNAAQFRVPQNRERLFLIGAKLGLPLPAYPVERTRPAGTEELALMPQGPSCQDALDDIPDADLFPELTERDSTITSEWGHPSPYAEQLRCQSQSDWGFGYKRVWNPAILSSSLRTEHTSISRRRFEETAGGNIEPISKFYKLPANGISNTLRAGTDSARGAFTSPRPIHYRYPRCVTVREMARLHGFPDWFRFHETKWHGARQVGNAVPPPLARAMAESVMAALGWAPQTPGKAIEMPHESLLRLDMSGAARFWDVAVPIGRRDRKSGASKRRQVDIEAERLATLEA
jgi:DNA (cytosine-5)-methyltransferase 1